MYSLAALAALIAIVEGCEASAPVADLCEEVGLCEGAPPAPEHVTLVLDGTPGSTANLASVEPALTMILERIADRPGSTLRIWTVGTGTDDSREVVSVTVPEPPRRLRNPRAHRETTIAALRAELVPGVTDALAQAAAQQRSAIAETITLAGRASPRSGRRWLVILSDLREMTLPVGFDLECPRELPSPERFTRSLERRGLLIPGPLDGVDVILVDGGLPAFPSRRRCDRSIRRGDELRALWTAALQRSGARRVVVAFGAPRFEDTVARDGDESPQAEEGGAR